MTVIGDALLDTFVECVPQKLCTEGPVPVVWRGREVSVPGGAANVAANLASLGAAVTLAGVTGRDPAGERLRFGLAELGVGLDALLPEPSCRTHHKMRILADGHYVVRVDEGDARDRSGRLRPVVRAALAGADLVVLSDYGLGVLDERLIGLVAAISRDRPDVPVVVDAKRPARFRRLRPTAITPNLDEAVTLAGARDRPERLARRVRRATDADLVALTLGADGAYLLDRSGRGELVRARPGQAASEVGAGDSFVAALALGLAVQAPPQAAALVAVEAAGIAVAKPYTAVVTASELVRSLALLGASDRNQLVAVV